MKKEVKNLKGSKEEYMGGFGGNKRKGNEVILL